MFGAAGTGKDMARATWAGGAQLGFEASQVTNRPFQSVVLGLESRATVLACGYYCLQMRRAIVGKGCKGKKTSCEEIEEKNRLKQRLKVTCTGEAADSLLCQEVSSSF